MEVKDLFLALEGANSVDTVEKLIDTFEETYSQFIKWVPVGNRENNIGTIGGSADPGRSLVERITNGIDAILELEHDEHSGKPDCRSPREAASVWLNIPANGLSELSTTERRKLAQKISIRIQAGESRESRIVEIRDAGIGITPGQMPLTILSLNESNKLQKYYVAGMYGQGGSSTFACSKFTLITSRDGKNPIIGFTVVKYLDLPAQSYKTGHYVYLTLNESVLQTELNIDEFPTGTQVKHFGYDLTSYSSPLGPNSVYGLLNSILFDPIIPVWLDNQVHSSRRVIKGSRNALNGAVDEDDENRRGPDLSHQMKMFFVNLGDLGRIGIEYWVLKKPEKGYKNAIKAFVNSQKPIVLTLNGQSHGEYSKILISKNAELPYLNQRLIGHIDCNSLSPEAKRSLFVSNREDARTGVVNDLIQQEFIKALKSDDILTRLNEEARSENLSDRDERAVEQMRREVANILRVQGFEPTSAVGAAVVGGNNTTDTPNMRTQPKRASKIIEIREPPTYIKIIWNEGQEIPFYPGQRRYIRVETDANSTYHDPNNPEKSKINIIGSSGLVVPCGSTALVNGRMRIVYESLNTASIGKNGQLRVELIRPGFATISDERQYIIIDNPSTKKSTKQFSLPPFVVIPIDPDDPKWDTLDWPEDINQVASSAIEEKGSLSIYYSNVFPKYVEKRNSYERRDPALAASFTKRYEVWIAVHSLLLNRDQQITDIDQDIQKNDPANSNNFELSEDCDRKERCRLAVIATIVAERELTYLESPSTND